MTLAKIGGDSFKLRPSASNSRKDAGFFTLQRVAEGAMAPHGLALEEQPSPRPAPQA